MRFRQEVSFYNDEYITNVLRTQDTKFDVLQGYVGAMITESELEELRNGDRTMYSRLAGAELTIDGLSRTYQEVRSDYAAVTGELNTLDSRVTEISESVDGITINVADIQIQANETDSQLAALSLTVDGFSSTVSQAKNEAISTANAATDSKLANYTRTANLMSYINQQTGSINLGVIANSSTLATKTYADTQATAAQNAAKNYADTQLTAYTKTADLTVDLDGIRTSVTEAKTEAVSTANAATDNKLKDYTKTAGLMSYINQQSGKIELGVIKNSSTLATKTYADGVGTSATNAANNATDQKLTAYTKTADLTVDLDGIRTSVTEAKTEAISTANAATDNKLKDYTKTAGLMSYINQQSGKIELGVIKNSSTLATKTYADNKATAATNAANNATDQKLTEYTKTANLEISINGIKTKVTSANIDLNGTKEAAVTAANAATDTKLAEYTKTASLMSYINQQAGSISLGVIEGGTGLATKTYADTQATAAKNAANTATDNKLKDYTKTANLEISINGIKTKVTSANIDLNGTKNAAVTAANAATDTKLAEYTKTASLMSYINQQAGSISLGVIEGGTGLATKTYADNKASSTLSSAKSYADTQAASAQSSAKTYTDNKTTAATITAAVNAAGSSITLNANKIKMDAETFALWAEAANLTAEQIRLSATTLTWSATNSSLNSSGVLTTKSLRATDLVILDLSNSSSYINIPIASANNYYTKMDSSGLSQRTAYGRLLMGSVSGIQAMALSGDYPLAIFSKNGVTAKNSIGDSCELAYNSCKVYKNGVVRTAMDLDGFYTTATKSRLVDTASYGRRVLYCYETPSPLFGDLGEGVVGEDGLAYVKIDPVFAETVSAQRYQVFLQKYGKGNIYILQRTPVYFIVAGDPGMAFGWEIKAKQSDFDQYRLETFELRRVSTESKDYGGDAHVHIMDLNNERMVS